ncbi:MAG TPA: serine hydrolase [Lacipirellulaceae bacterium]|nr:serine hydrolase [Lacipirellulaceae bacterium]
MLLAHAKWITHWLCAAAILSFYHDAVAFEWNTAAPQDEGFSAQRLDELKKGLANRRTKALLIIRNDRIVCEWYAAGHGKTDPHYTASMAKALIGGVALAVAIEDGRIALDDRVSKFVPQWRDDPRKSQITVRQLGSHTSGLADAEDGDTPHEQLTGWKGDFWMRLDPPRDPFSISRDVTPLLFEPGTRRQYSNPGIAMLSYVVTAAIRDAPIKDLRTLLRERVMRPIGVPDKEWSCGYGRTFDVAGLPIVASWGGGGFTARAAARVGRLMLRKGEWDGRRIIRADAVRQTTASAGLPGAGGMGWWTNAEGRCPSLPADAFWAAGAGGQVLLVVPSLQLVALRNGGNLDDGDNDQAIDRYFFTPLIDAMLQPAAREPETRSGLPQSPFISQISWAPRESVVRLARGSDNWPITWGDDDAIYTAYGDGRGFEPFVPEKLSLGLAKVTGRPPKISGVNLRASSIESTGDGASGHKASGILMVDGVLYLLVRNVENAKLAWSTDRGANWTLADWNFTESFGAPTFVNFGRDYDGARDDFVYIVSHDADSAYEIAGGFVLARAPKEKLRDEDAWQYFAGFIESEPAWTNNVARRSRILENDGVCYRAGVSYNAPLGRYLLVHPLPTKSSRDSAGKLDTRFAGGLAIYDAPEPWGPWSAAFYTESWDVGPGETCSFPTKWMSADGRTLHLVFSGDDCFSVRKAELTTAKQAP